MDGEFCCTNVRLLCGKVCRLGLMLWSLSLPLSSHGQHREESTVRAATAAFREIESLKIQGIPQAFLADAHAIAIVPDVVKGSFVIGAKHGRGVLIVRSEEGWEAPILVSLTGGNVGWQVGVQVTDVILVFKSARSVESALSGKLTLGADVAIAAGPVGRNAEAVTDTGLKAEIYSYSRSRGLFAGVAFDGSVLRIDSVANANYYGDAMNGVIPDSAIMLVNQVAEITGRVSPDPNLPNNAAQNNAPKARNNLARRFAVDESTDLRNQLAQTAPRLYQLLDESWQDFLALPAEVFRNQGHAAEDELRRSLERFDAIARDGRYRDLSARREFQSTHSLLRDYLLSRRAPADKLQLPQPPAVSDRR